MLKRRAGIAIVAALGGIVVIGALIAGVFFVSAQESQISGGAVVHERAFRAAELGLHTTLNAWDNVGMATMAVGARKDTAYSGTGWVDTVVVTKLTQRAYSLLSSATAGSGRLARSRKRTLLNVRTSSPDFNFMGALTVRGSLTVGGSSYIDGADRTPTGWGGCGPLLPSMPGIAIPDASKITYNGNAQQVTGDPPVQETAAANDTTNYFVFGDETWASLTQSAEKVYNGSTTLSSIEPVVVNGACDKSASQNWGAPHHTDPANACQNYFPTIHFKGASSTVKLTGKMGQGILLVDGNLEISGNFEFYGPVIVRGTLRSHGTGGKLNGAVMAASTLLEESTSSGNSVINYSSCAVQKALQGASNPRRISERAWIEVH
ncbi:MAG TPA: hypothetical protein VMM77_05560 [Gemmatimonadaceae bacterium]|nr:hypothetical protein [Gemmatimonadaceae bacterium]